MQTALGEIMLFHGHGRSQHQVATCRNYVGMVGNRAQRRPFSKHLPSQLHCPSFAGIGLNASLVQRRRVGHTLDLPKKCIWSSPNCSMDYVTIWLCFGCFWFAHIPAICRNEGLTYQGTHQIENRRIVWAVHRLALVVGLVHKHATLRQPHDSHLSKSWCTWGHKCACEGVCANRRKRQLQLSSECITERLC